MRWAAGLIFYQDKASLKRTLDCITPHFDHVFCIDGRWRNYPAPNDLSTDGSRELVKQYPNTILYDAGGLKQPDKRQKYFDLAKEYGSDILLIIDSDEWFAGDVNQWKQEIEALCSQRNGEPVLINVWFRVTREEPHEYQWLAKLCYLPGRFTYRQDHFNCFDRKRQCAISSIDGNKHVTFMHDDKLREHEWTERQTRHDLWQIIYELQFRCKNKPRIDRHVQKYGFDAVEQLLADNKELVDIVASFQLNRQARPDTECAANPEYKEFGQAVRRWMSS